DYCSGVSLLVRRSAWKSVGGMDEGYYPAYYEDVDLCLKLEADGMDVLVQPASVVVHHGSTSPLRYREFLGNRNRRRLVARWSSLLESRPAPRPGDPEAIARAFRSAARRERAGGRVPGLADERTGPEQDVTGVFDRKEREIKDEYIAEMEGAFDLLEREVEELRGARAEFERQREQHAGLAAEIESLRSSRDDARCELEAVRSRAGYRIVDKVHSVLRRVPGVFHVVRWLLRTIQRPPRSKLDREGGRARVPTPSE
ncbi:MAG TPA: hypothetical protein VMR97_12050, partial [Acidimicrobiales bacterium]|nr:hypothetical protein [Acidimicrobiales bacterium]